MSTNVILPGPSRVRPLQEAPGDPLYVRVASAIRRRVGEEGLSSGDLIAPERVLVEEFGVSRITLRRAIDLLVDEHLLVRRRGLGTFVASPKVPYPLVGLHSTRDIARAHGLTPEVRILEYEIARPTPAERSRLELGSRAQVLRLARQDLVSSRPMSVAECVLPARLASALSAEALAERSTYELIEQNLDIRISRARQTLYAEPASLRIAQLLDVEPGHALFVIDRVTLDAGGIPVEWGVISYPHSGIECVVELFRESASRNESATGVALRYVMEK